MSMREEFEAVARAHQKAKFDFDDATLDVVLEQNTLGGYESVWLQGAWWAWQASREALVIELPRVCASDDPFDLKQDIAYELELAGVRVKP